MAVFTTRLNLKKPAGGSSGTIPGDDQADIDDINDNSDIIDEAIGFAPVLSTGLPGVPFNGQPVMITDANGMLKVRNGAAWLDPGIIGRGTAAQRDAYWPAPGDAAARVALANLHPRWYNTDKGWEEQYYAAWNDAGVGANTPVRDAAGWAPTHTVGRVLITKFTAAKVGAPGTVTKKGGKLEFDTAEGFTVDGVFTSDFDRYEMELTSTGGSGTGVLNAQFRAAGVTDSSANYSWSMREIVPGTAEAAIGPVAQMEISRAFNLGFILKSTIANPTSAARKTQMLNHMFDTDTKTRIGGSQLNLAKAVDGIYLDFSSTLTFTGEVRFYGIPG